MFVSHLFGYHLRLIGKNLTTHESLKQNVKSESLHSNSLFERKSMLSNIYCRLFKYSRYPSFIALILTQGE